MNMRLGRSVEIKDSFHRLSCSVGPLSFLGDSLIGENSYLGAFVGIVMNGLIEALFSFGLVTTNSTLDQIWLSCW